MASNPPLPVILFTYNRPTLLQQTLDSLRVNRVPLLYAFSDGPRNTNDNETVREVRSLLRKIDWCDVQLTERKANLGLGPSILSGVTEVANRHEMFIVWEDDLVAVQGAYEWMCAALRHYATDSRVMSVTAWTHHRFIPSDARNRPYFDGRAECWVWGAYARSWRGMTEETALGKVRQLKAMGGNPSAYGADLTEMAEQEVYRRIWAVRWVYHHLLKSGLCLRPPRTLVDHLGVGRDASNVKTPTGWEGQRLSPPDDLFFKWPIVEENPKCAEIWSQSKPARPWWRRVLSRLKDRLAFRK